MPHLDVSEGTPLYILVAFIFILANAFFVAAEFALVKIRHTRLETLVGKGNAMANLAHRMVSKLDAYLSATQLGITLASLGLGWVGEPAFSKLITRLLHMFGAELSEKTLHSVSLTIAFLFISALHIILGELVPKSIAIRTAERVLMVVAFPLHVFYTIFYPFLWVLNGTANAVLKIMKMPPAHGPLRAHHTEEELKLIFEDTFEEGVIGSHKRILLDKAMDFSHKTIADIMIPASQMICFFVEDSIQENLFRAKESGHTRFPLFERKGGNLLGFVHIKDVIWSMENNKVINIFDVRRPLIFFKDKNRIDFAMIRFQREKRHVAIVKNNKEEIVGLVTMEDVIEELVGEIEDEFDTDGSTLQRES